MVNKEKVLKELNSYFNKKEASVTILTSYIRRIYPSVSLKEIGEIINEFKDGKEPMKQERYLDKEGKKDLIDRWAETRTHDQFRTIIFAMIEKYFTRLGKKDGMLQEVTKMHDYMTRWLEYEKFWNGSAPSIDMNDYKLVDQPDTVECRGCIFWVDEDGCTCPKSIEGLDCIGNNMVYKLKDK